MVWRCFSRVQLEVVIIFPKARQKSRPGWLMKIWESVPCITHLLLQTFQTHILMHEDIDHPRHDKLLPLHPQNSAQEICVGIRCLVAHVRCKDVQGYHEPTIGCLATASHVPDGHVLMAITSEVWTCTPMYVHANCVKVDGLIAMYCKSLTRSFSGDIQNEHPHNSQMKLHMMSFTRAKAEGTLLPTSQNRRTEEKS
ncbi:hypothetical protein VNO77_02466 [Canavalia gladiata]|uniref:Uncharacterized protein n=1 Tax=Canavalia gladiata TaxID=3824 RepID=A0AAN9R657_CANGL